MIRGMRAPETRKPSSNGVAVLGGVEEFDTQADYVRDDEDRQDLDQPVHYFKQEALQQTCVLSMCDEVLVANVPGTENVEQLQNQYDLHHESLKVHTVLNVSTIGTVTVSG